MDWQAYRKTEWFKKAFSFKGYGIEVIDTYLEDNGYTEPSTLKVVDLKVAHFRQSHLERGVNNCSLCSIVRVVDHLTKGTEKEEDVKDRYKEVLEYARRHGYTDKRGTPFIRIRGVFKHAISRGGLDLKPSTSFSFMGARKKLMASLDAGRPLLINLAFGYYNNHTITATGYKLIKCLDKKGREKEKLFVRVVDGWSTGTSFMDWDAFARSASLGIGTLTFLKDNKVN